MNTTLVAIAGIALSLSTAATAALLRLEKRTFYATIMIVIASYYVLFAIMSGAYRVLSLATLIASAFIALVALGARFDARLITVALALHGAFDVVHGDAASHAGVPAWWPPFCLAYDLTTAAMLAWSLRKSARGVPMRDHVAPCGMHAAEGWGVRRAGDVEGPCSGGASAPSAPQCVDEPARRTPHPGAAPHYT